MASRGEMKKQGENVREYARNEQGMEICTMKGVYNVDKYSRVIFILQTWLPQLSTTSIETCLSKGPRNGNEKSTYLDSSPHALLQADLRLIS